MRFFRGIAVCAVVVSGHARAQHWFPGQSTYPQATAQGTFCAAGDFNGDGKIDLLVNEGSAVRTWLNFGARAELQAGPQSSLLAGMQVMSTETVVGDVTGDGLADVLMPRSAAGGAPGVGLLRALGQGDFAVESAPLPNAPIQLALGDANGDGVLDLIAVHPGSSGAMRLSWLTWNGSALQAVGSLLLSISAPYQDLESLDVDGDGWEDAVLSHLGTLYPFLSSGGSFHIALPTIQSQLPKDFGTWLVAADFDADGRRDLLAVDASPFGPQELQLFPGQAGGGFDVQAVQLLPVPLSSDPRAVDWDGDHDLDLVAHEPLVFAPTGVELVENLDGYSFGTPLLLETGTGGSLVAALDLDGDTLADAVGPKGVYFGDASFGSVSTTPLDTVGPALAIDREGDGDLDLYSSSLATALRSNDGSGAYAIAPLPAGPANLDYFAVNVIGDLSGDGRLDFLVDLYTQFVFVPPFVPATFVESRFLRDDGLGHFVDMGPAAPAGVGIPWQGPFGLLGAKLPLRTGDFDVDGDLDVLDLNGSLWLNQGSSASPWFPAPSALIGVSGTVAATGDLDGDGKVDLLAHVGGPAQVLVTYRNLGGLQFAASDVFAAPIIAPEARLLDLDGDGDLDIACWTPASPPATSDSRLHLLENLGGNFASPVSSLASPLAAPNLYALDDVNGDGVFDLLLGRSAAQFSSDSLKETFGVLLGTGQPFHFQGAHAWRYSAVQAFLDADSDGDLDCATVTSLQRNRRVDGQAGSIRQYGVGSPGGGGASTLLGASGPLNVGSSSAALRVAYGQGGALGLLVVGHGEAALSDAPIPGLTLLVNTSAAAFVPLQLTGSGNGAGMLCLPVQVDPSMAGLMSWLQLFSLDLNSTTLLTNSNGLELRFGQ